LAAVVRVVDDGRTELLTQALQTSDVSVGERVAHAIAQFRGRSATVHDNGSEPIVAADQS
jgi:hypothetical protein